ncbi:MAG: ATP-binding cassette domain-containing protein [Bacillota bacterium]
MFAQILKTGQKIIWGDNETPITLNSFYNYPGSIRKEMGLFLEMSIQDNATISSLDDYVRFGLINSKSERDKVEGYIKEFHIKTTDPDKKVVNLSGGNQQKVVLARSTSTLPKLIILDEPTRGVEVGAKSETYKLMYQLASQGVGILMISSELSEVLGVSD